MTDKNETDRNDAVNTDVEDKNTALSDAAEHSDDASIENNEEDNADIVDTGNDDDNNGDDEDTSGDKVEHADGDTVSSIKVEDTVDADGEDQNGDGDGNTAASSDEPSDSVGLKNHGDGVPSFASLREEHDNIIIARLVLTIVVALILLIPLPLSMLGIKFVLFTLLAYASIYNEVDLRKEHELRQDEFSRKAHIASYVCFAVVLVLFLLLAVIAGSRVNTVAEVASECLNVLNSNGFGPIILK